MGHTLVCGCNRSCITENLGMKMNQGNKLWGTGCVVITTTLVIIAIIATYKDCSVSVQQFAFMSAFDRTFASTPTSASSNTGMLRDPPRRSKSCRNSFESREHCSLPQKHCLFLGTPSIQIKGMSADTML